MLRLRRGKKAYKIFRSFSSSQSHQPSSATDIACVVVRSFARDPNEFIINFLYWLLSTGFTTGDSMRPREEGTKNYIYQVSPTTMAPEEKTSKIFGKYVQFWDKSENKNKYRRKINYGIDSDNIHGLHRILSWCSLVSMLISMGISSQKANRESKLMFREAY